MPNYHQRGTSRLIGNVIHCKWLKMKLKYEEQKGFRINYKFMGFSTHEQGWWFSNNSNKWEKNPEAGENGYSSHQDCKSMKAFRRKLKKAPKGVKFYLVSRWVGYGIDGVGSCGV